MIRFIGGHPGAGKTKYGVAEFFLREVVATNRFIVTNAAIKLYPWVDGGGVARKGLQRELLDRFGDDFDCVQRVVLLDDSQVKRFYAFRPRFNEVRDCIVEELPQHDDGRFRLNAEEHGGVFYFIDEIHEHFNAREWQKTGKEALSWASQHRRAGDEMLALTQVISNVEKQFRGLSQECIWVTNHRHLSLGFFRQPDIITYSSYSSTPPGPAETPLRKGKLRYDKELIHSIYDTASGVGVSGRGADIKQRARGLHWSFAPLAVLCLVILLGLVSSGVRNAIRKVVGIESAKNVGVQGQVGSSVVPTIVTQVVVQRVESKVMQHNSQSAVAVPVRNLRPWAVGFTKGVGAAILMSDRTILTGTNAEVVNGGYLLDGVFVSGRPTEASNLTSYVDNDWRVDRQRQRR